VSLSQWEANIYPEGNVSSWRQFLSVKLPRDFAFLTQFLSGRGVAFSKISPILSGLGLNHFDEYSGVFGFLSNAEEIRGFWLESSHGYEVLDSAENIIHSKHIIQEPIMDYRL
jgi:hypothetical protein